MIFPEIHCMVPASRLIYDEIKERWGTEKINDKYWKRIQMKKECLKVQAGP